MLLSEDYELENFNLYRFCGYLYNLCVALVTNKAFCVCIVVSCLVLTLIIYHDNILIDDKRRRLIWICFGVSSFPVS